MRADRQQFELPAGTRLPCAFVLAVVLMCLMLEFEGSLLAVAANSLLVGVLVHHILGESKRLQLTVRSRTAALRDIAYRDSLTGLPNRRFFIWYLEQNLSMHMQNRRRGARVNRVVLFDLNGFKAVNDNYGHEAGDELLKFIAVTLTAYLPSDALLARLGGDEFVVLVRDSHWGRKTREVEATIRKAAATVFVFDGQEISVSASVGVSSPAEAGSTSEQLLRESDQRMYADKIAGKAERGELVIDEQNPDAFKVVEPSLNERRRIRARLMLSESGR